MVYLFTLNNNMSVWFCVYYYPRWRAVSYLKKFAVESSTPRLMRGIIGYVTRDLYNSKQNARHSCQVISYWICHKTDITKLKFHDSSIKYHRTQLAWQKLTNLSTIAHIRDSRQPIITLSRDSRQPITTLPRDSCQPIKSLSVCVCSRYSRVLTTVTGWM